MSVQLVLRVDSRGVAEILESVEANNWQPAA